MRVAQLPGAIASHKAKDIDASTINKTNLNMILNSVLPTEVYGNVTFRNEGRGGGGAEGEIILV